MRTYGISEEGPGGRTEQCWDEKSVGAEQLAEAFATVGQAESGARRVVSVFVQRTGWALLELETALAHMGLEELCLNTQTLEEEDQPVAAKSAWPTGYRELEHICSAVGHSMEVRYMVKGRVEWEAASYSGRFAV